MLGIAIHASGYSPATGPQQVLLALVVANGCQGRGVGTLLAREVCRSALGAGACGLWWNAVAEHEARVLRSSTGHQIQSPSMG